jgi:hypothetical protein
MVDNSVVEEDYTVLKLLESKCEVIITFYLVTRETVALLSEGPHNTCAYHHWA